jgi:branched-chain amino acid aminotransferase
MIFLNNKLVPDKQAKVSIFDHGFLYGDGVYDTLRVYNGTVFMADEHIERLFRSAEMIRLALPLRHDAMKRAVYRTLEANRHCEAYVRISVSRGPGPIGLDPELCPKPTFLIISMAFKDYPKSFYRKGVKTAIVSVRRNYKHALNPKIKSHNFLNNILATIEAKDRGAYEAIMLNCRGYIAEGTITNIFFVKNNVLCTPGIDVGILDGITRRLILDTARELNVRIKEGRFRRQALYRAEEVFISSTTKEVMPVSEVDGRKIGKGVGKLTRKLHGAYKRKVSEYLATGRKKKE